MAALAGKILGRSRRQRTRALFSKGPALPVRYFQKARRSRTLPLNLAAEPRRVARTLPLKLVASRRWEGPILALEDVAGREGRAQGEGARCFGRDGLWKVSLAAYVRVGFERPGVQERRRRTTLRRAAVIGRCL